MVNTELLNAKIKESGLLRKYIAETLEITPVTLTRKVRGANEFKPSEITKLCDILNISKKDVNSIFFAK